MKKLLVFLSIFAVLFVSTIRPLQAEFINDNFTLVNGNTYYFLISQEQIAEGQYFPIALNEPYTVINLDAITFDDFSFDVSYRLNSNSTVESFVVPLTYIGSIDDYFGYNGDNIGPCYVYSFVWSAPSVYTLIYDDYYFAFDTENPLPPISIYDTIYSLVNKYVFGNNIESGSHQDLTATILSTTICVLVFALPFLIIWKVIKIIMG